MIKINEKLIVVDTSTGTRKYKIIKKDPRYTYFNDTLGNKLRYDSKNNYIEQNTNNKWDVLFTEDEIYSVDIE